MTILFLTNPDVVDSQSMPRFADMVIGGMKQRGHAVKTLTSKARFSRFSSRPFLRKWLSYFDRFVFFRKQLADVRASLSENTLVVCLDQALGPWLPFFRDVPLVTHCHDLLSIRAARSEFPHTCISSTGKVYNRYIHHGLRSCAHFVAVSDATKRDIDRLLSDGVQTSRVVYNGFNGSFSPGDPFEAQRSLTTRLRVTLDHGYLLHVGGNNWYKNKLGVVKLYEAWRRYAGVDTPLLLVGPKPSGSVARAIEGSEFSSEIHTLDVVEDDLLLAAYRGARALLFPSIAEGFGWPIAEAMACGCPVVTTGLAPMTEVGAEDAYYIPVMPAAEGDVSEWAQAAATVIQRAVEAQQCDRIRLMQVAETVRQRFSTENALNQIETIYFDILKKQKAA